MPLKHNKEEQIADDIGFGKSYVGINTRMLNADGTFNIEKIGTGKRGIYEHFINIRPLTFFLQIIIISLLINIFFAFLYYLNGVENINIAPKDVTNDFLNCFFFSIQTFTSVGYGFLNPQNIIANIVAGINAFLGLLGLAMATGLLFARFSKSRAHIAFSDNALISPLNGEKTLQFRIVNKSTSTLINMESAATLTWLEREEGVYRRRFARLKLELDFIYLFPLNWTLVHKINENSPLQHKSIQELINQNGEILIMIKGYDDTYDQHIYKNHSYHSSDIVENAVFKVMYESQTDKTILRLDKLNDYRLIR